MTPPRAQRRAAFSSRCSPAPVSTESLLFNYEVARPLKGRSRATKANPIKRTLIALRASHWRLWASQSTGRRTISHVLTRLLIGTGPVTLNTMTMTQRMTAETRNTVWLAGHRHVSKSNRRWRSNVADIQIGMILPKEPGKYLDGRQKSLMILPS
jgi:hypothetical protein